MSGRLRADSVPERAGCAQLVERHRRRVGGNFHAECLVVERDVRLDLADGHAQVERGRRQPRPRAACGAVRAWSPCDPRTPRKSVALRSHEPPGAGSPEPGRAPASPDGDPVRSDARAAPAWNSGAGQPAIHAPSMSGVTESPASASRIACGATSRRTRASRGSHIVARPAVPATMKKGAPKGATASRRTLSGRAKPAWMRPRSFALPTRPERPSSEVTEASEAHCGNASRSIGVASSRVTDVVVGNWSDFGAQAIVAPARQTATAEKKLLRAANLLLDRLHVDLFAIAVQGAPPLRHGLLFAPGRPQQIAQVILHDGVGRELRDGLSEERFGQVVLLSAARTPTPGCPCTSRSPGRAAARARRDPRLRPAARRGRPACSPGSSTWGRDQESRPGRRGTRSRLPGTTSASRTSRHAGTARGHLRETGRPFSPAPDRPRRGGRRPRASARRRAAW